MALIVTGLNSNRFLAGNPIPVTFALDAGTFPSGSLIRLTITKEVTFAGQTAQTLPGIDLYLPPSSLTIDLAPYIKGLLPLAYVPGSDDPVPNYQVISVAIGYYATPGGSQTEGTSYSNKNYVRGWSEGKKTTAYTVAINQILRDSDLIPVWNGYPVSMYYMETDSTIRSTPVVPDAEQKLMKLPSSCDPFYVRYLNSKGGYGYYLFDVWEWDMNSEDKGHMDRSPSPNHVSLGYDRDDKVTAQARVRRDFYPMIRALLLSPVIQVYNKFGSDWTAIKVSDSSFQESSYEDMAEVSIDFELLLNINAAQVW